MAQTISAEAIASATGRSWDEWLSFYEKMDAKSLPHKEIALRTHEEGGVDGWWSQMLTVQYEQHTGRRIPGQDCNGEFSVSVSKTLPGTMDAALRWWMNAVDGRTEFSDVPVTRGPDVSKTEKWRYWRCGLGDGSRVVVHIYQKAPDKASLSIGHESLESTEQLDHWRAYWKTFLDEAAG